MDANRLSAACTLVGALLAGACSAGAGKSDTAKGSAIQAGSVANDPAVRQAIDSADQKFAAAMKSSDAATAASFYEDNATSMPPNMEAETGRAAIEKGFTQLFKDVGKINDFTAETKDFDAYGDHIIEVGSYNMSFTPPGAKAPMKDHGTFINYWRKQPDGSWKIHRDAIVSATPMPNAPPAGPMKK